MKKDSQVQTGICYLIGAGDFGDGTPAPRPEDLVIAGDGGFRHCQERGIRVDLTVGDFDSLGYRPDHPHVLQLPAEKDDTDMRAALNLGWERGYRDFRLYGGTGGRISHTMANIQLLAELAARGGRGILVGENSWYRVLRNDHWDFDGSETGYLSVFSLSDRAEGVCEQGLKYEVQDVTLTNEYPVGVSNEFTGRTGFVSVREGTLLLIWERK
ncbi:MAG: thiamine diphosphokinase [Lachnospiraceae bacterium]|nr:thiamine diphosphokinase [Lachnospiraceae bacterium]